MSLSTISLQTPFSLFPDAISPIGLNFPDAAYLLPFLGILMATILAQTSFLVYHTCIVSQPISLSLFQRITKNEMPPPKTNT